MPRGSVLVIDDDEWVSNLLASAIRDADYDVVVCTSAKEGLNAACSTEPDCIICDIGLPDNDGYWVARNVRTQPSRVAVTPFLFLSGLDDEASRLQGFHVGADVYMTKPFRSEEVVAQIGALVQMAKRLRERRDSMISPPSTVDSAIEGDLSQMSIATVLTVLEMERRSGLFEVVSKKRRASLDIVLGQVAQGTVGGTRISALSAMRTIISWNVGRFSFHAAPPSDFSPQSERSLGALLIEAMRLQDETTRAELELPPSKQRPSYTGEEPKIIAPALGGPASSPADFAPPSSRTPDFVRPSERAALGSLEPDLADWEIPSAIATPASPQSPLPKPPPLQLPRPATFPPSTPGAQRHGARALPVPPAPPRIHPAGPPLDPDPVKKR
jgi:two-component system, OmpR family, response regulator